MKTTNKLYPLFFLLLFFQAICPLNLIAQQKVIIGYVGGFRGLINTEMIDPQQLTHINYAFVDIKNNRAWLHRESTDTVNFRQLNLLKLKNPALRILISVGGWAWSGRFSDAVLTDTARHAFAASAVAIIAKYQLDGIDIDWEYPGRPGLEGNVFRPEDKQNYTLMFHDIRKQLDSLQQRTGKKLLLTTAAGAFKSFLNSTNMGDAQQYLDYINLMTYDYSGGKVAGHHTNLYPSKTYHSSESADSAFIYFTAAGVPASKLVMGVAFYGRSSNLIPGAKGIGDTIETYSKGRGFAIIKDSLVNMNGFKMYRDKDAKADYLYNASNRQFVTYDDEWSVEQKCRYVKNKKMAGVMFWKYVDDPKGYLLAIINKVLK